MRQLCCVVAVIEHARVVGHRIAAMDSGNGPDETSPGRKRSIPNLEELLATRLYGLRGGVAFERRVKRHAAWAEGLRLTSVLRHHTGCVNTLEVIGVSLADPMQC